MNNSERYNFVRIKIVKLTNPTINLISKIHFSQKKKKIKRKDKIKKTKFKIIK